MIYLKDIKTGEIFNINSESDSENFCDTYENPQNLISIDVWYCDGAGFNGIVSKTAVGRTKEDMKIWKITEEMTNNQMEYLAVITAMYQAEPYSLILSDSQLVVNQCTKDWSCNYEHLIPHRDKVRELIKIKNLSLKWIPREENIAGKVLERLWKNKK